MFQYLIATFAIVGTQAQFSSVASCFSVKNCPVGWARYEDQSCFKVSSVKASFDAAKQDCTSQGAILASPNSVEESNFISNYVTQKIALDQLIDMWLGGRKQAGKGFVWQDSSPIAVTNWVPTYPIPTGDCLFLCTSGPRQINTQDYTFGLLANADCSIALQYVCQKSMATTISILYQPGLCS